MEFLCLSTRDKDMCEFIHDHLSMASDPVGYTNHPAVIASVDNMISINAAMEVDLLGQCNSEHLRG
jgi:itaconate CoA-transferase